MTWFKVDDGLFSHPKVLAIPAAQRARALGLWVLAGAYSAKYLTDGHVPRSALASLASTERDASALVASGLWTACEGGWQFVDWASWQPTRAEVERDREASRERMRNMRARRAAGHKANEDKRYAAVRANTSVTEQAVTENFSASVRRNTSAGVRNPRPDPTRPDQVGSSVVSQSTSVPGARTDRPTDKTNDTEQCDVDLDRVRGVVGGNLAWAARVANDILARAGDVKDPTRYVLAAVEKDPGRYRPTLTPDRIAYCRHGIVAAACGPCLEARP